MKDIITYDDFTKLDIVIGEIKSAEVVENADKLFRLEVDFAETDEEGNPQYRQIISGIREYFDSPENLVGVRCPFLINLEPRTIRGYESQGMILAAKNENTLALLPPHRDLPAGTRIN